MAQVKSRVFLDANILFTACYNPVGSAFHLIQNPKKFEAIWIMSDYAFNEAEYNLKIKKPERIDKLGILEKFIEVFSVPLDQTYNPLKLPNSDIPIFQAALFTKCSHLLTGDKKAFGAWMNNPKKTFGITIQTIRHFVDDYLPRKA